MTARKLVGVMEMLGKVKKRAVQVGLFTSGVAVGAGVLLWAQHKQYKEMMEYRELDGDEPESLGELHVIGESDIDEESEDVTLMELFEEMDEMGELDEEDHKLDPDEESEDTEN